MTNSTIKSKAISFVETPNVIAELMVSLISEQKEEISILDTGCGKGIFLENLLKRGFVNIDGIELNNDLFSFCLERFSEVQIYNEDFLDWVSNKKYDVIIGNPPYAHFNSLPKSARRKVEQIVESKESDIYYAFILKAIERLKEDGELIYIVPYGFFYNTFARKVREALISKGFLELVIDLDETRLFEGENPETIIMKYKHKKPNKKQKIRIIRTLNKNSKLKDINTYAVESLAKKESNAYFHYHEKAVYDSADVVWSTFPEIKIPSSTTLHEVAWVGVGLVTGFEKAFVIEEDDEKELSNEEKNGIIPVVKARHCKGYWVEGQTQYILIDHIVDSEEQFKQQFPDFYSKMFPFKEEMRRRYLPLAKKWFNWQALRNFGDYESNTTSTKIYVPILDRSKTNRFSLSYDKLYPSGDVLTIIPQKIDSFFLLGYLNSDFFRKYYLSAGARRGHRIAFTQRVMSNIKIPSFKTEICDKISSLSKLIIEEKNTEYRNEIEVLIKSAFDNSDFNK